MIYDEIVNFSDIKANASSYYSKYYDFNNLSLKYIENLHKKYWLYASLTSLSEMVLMCLNLRGVNSVPSPS